MTILQIAILTIAAVLIGQLRRGRQLAMLAMSVVVLFWLQPPQPFVSLRFWLPIATLGITILSWVITSPPEVRPLRENWPAAAVMLGAVALAESNRYLKLDVIYAVHPPAPWLVLFAVAGITLLALALSALQRAAHMWRWAVLLGIVVMFVLLKSPLLAQGLERSIAAAQAESAPQAVAALSWLGYSYLAFRLMHTIRDRQAGRLPAVPLADYLDYAIFFPSLTAGPIDRLDRFEMDLCRPLPLANEEWIEAGSRLFVGLFKKFVVADLLAVISISDGLVRNVKSTPWLWVFLYAYALRIFFDFSGYTDIAIGMARLMGIRLPENFAAPYLKTNLTQFWNSWHMTLTQWFRAYVFNPFTRAMRSAKPQLPAWLIILLAQLLTMTLIGLWHGIAATFVLWGLWHGIGLFIHNRWSDFIRPRTPPWMQSGAGLRLANAAGAFLTFNYVAIGWLFFTLSTPVLAWQAFLKLAALA